MQAWRVTGPGLFHLFYACWNPEQARLYPLDFERLAFHGGGGPARSLVAQQVRRGAPPAGSPSGFRQRSPRRPAPTASAGSHGTNGVNGLHGVAQR